MSTSTAKPKPKTPRQMRPECCNCEECTSGSRNNYFLGKRLTPDSLQAEQTYFLERRRLLNRAIHGWGVVYGYPVAMAPRDQNCPGAESGQLIIGEGLGLDKQGRELVLTGPVALTFDSVTLLDEHGHPDKHGQIRPDPQACWLLNVHYAEQQIGRTDLSDSCSCTRTVWDRVCETVRFSLRPVPCEKCCADHDCELECRCASGPCCEEMPAADPTHQRPTIERPQHGTAGAHPTSLMLDESGREELITHQYREAAPLKEHGRGGCRCLCEHLTGLKVGADCTGLCPVDDCAHADLHNGLALACVKLDVDQCGNTYFAAVYDDCGPRRLVKRNDLLFDLIRGCDATRIIKTGWGHWHRSQTPVPFHDFVDALGYDNTNNDSYVSKRFWVEFSRPVRADTLLPDCFAMTIMSTETEGGWWQTYRVPVIDIEKSERENNDPQGYVRKAGIIVDGNWLLDAVVGRKTIFQAGLTRVEIEVRGDFITDCNGQTVDANPRGHPPFPSGSDGPGDSYLSTFTVAQAHSKN